VSKKEEVREQKIPQRSVYAAMSVCDEERVCECVHTSPVEERSMYVILSVFMTMSVFATVNHTEKRVRVFTTMSVYATMSVCDNELCSIKACRKLPAWKSG